VKGGGGEDVAEVLSTRGRFGVGGQFPRLHDSVFILVGPRSSG